jgi:hypothetical protein
MPFERNLWIGRESELLHSAPNHVPLAFYTLTGEPLHLRRSSSSYWKHLTLGGMSIYREVLQACEYEQGTVRCMQEILEMTMRCLSWRRC